MPKKKMPQTIEECNAELERTQKQLQQYENRDKMYNFQFVLILGIINVILPVIPVLSHRGWFGMVENGWKFIWVAAIMILLPFVSSLAGIIIGSIQLKKASTKPVKMGLLLSCTGLVMHLLFRFVFKL